MPADLEFAGYAQAFPFAKLGAGGRPRGQDGFLPDHAWALGATTDRPAIIIDVDIGCGAGWVFAVTDSQVGGLTTVIRISEGQPTASPHIFHNDT